LVKPSKKSQILLVTRDASVLDLAQNCSEDQFCHLDVVGSAWEALERVNSGPGPDLVLLDVMQSDSDSLHSLRWLRRVRPELPVVVLCNYDESHKLEVMRLGARECLAKPLQSRPLEAAIQRSLFQVTENSESEIVASEIEQIGDDMFFVAACPGMRNLRAQAELLAQVGAPVLISGESGSGKDLAARLIHKLSVRSGFRFIKINCSTLPGDVLETELFGLENGQVKPGKLDLCQKGTLLLDDVTEMPLNVQAKLLAVLRDGYFVRSGGESRIEMDVRILAATPANLEQAIAEGKIREDLYYRLSAYSMHVPALEQRKEEIPLLLSYFMNQLARRYNLPPRVLPRTVLDACQRRSWPGNLRELEKFAKRYLIMGDEEPGLDTLDSDGDSAFWNLYLPPTREPAGRAPEAAEIQANSSGLKSLVQSVKGEAERNAITTALEQARWNRKSAARLLKISYRTLLYKIDQYHMSPPISQLSYGTSKGGFRDVTLNKTT
jgi:two-component system response regulator AtoC